MYIDWLFIYILDESDFAPPFPLNPMKLATFRILNGSPRVGIVHSDDRQVFDLSAGVARLGGDPAAFADMLALMNGGDRALDIAREAQAKHACDPAINHSIDDVELLSPVPVPMSIRDFVAFPAHIHNAPRALRGLATQLGIGSTTQAIGPAPLDVPPVYRRHPNYYKGNRFTVIGSNAAVRRPRDSRFLDYELEFGIFIGRNGIDVPHVRARDHIFGYAVFNDFSARDIQVYEMGGMTGPCKSKDFATGNAIGPWIVTADEVPDPYALAMHSRVNGETWCSGSSQGMLHSFEDMIAYVSRDEPLRPGEFFGSGTVGGGTGMEINRYLQDGDIVELEVQCLGVLLNRIESARD